MFTLKILKILFILSTSFEIDCYFTNCPYVTSGHLQYVSFFLVLLFYASSFIHLFYSYFSCNHVQQAGFLLIHFCSPSYIHPLDGAVSPWCGCARAHGHPAGKLYACMAMGQHLAARPIGLLHVDELSHGSRCGFR